MIKRLSGIFAFLILGSNILSAQDSRHGGDVWLLEFDGKTALFASEGISAKKGDILRNAEETLFERLLYTGIDGINDSRPLVNKPREQLQTKDYAVNFFKKRMHAYLKTDASGKNVLSEQIGQVVSAPGGYGCIYLIPVKYNVLIRDLKTEGLLNQ